MVDDSAQPAEQCNEGPRTRSRPGDGQDGSAEHRDRTAEDRDQIAEAHDRTAESRDEAAESRDRRAESREHPAVRYDSGAASDRAGAWRDRRGGANDRGHAADDRVAASTDRILSAQERVASSIDELTGTHRRDPGLVELNRELARAKRTQAPFVLVFIDVDGLKATNDSLGHTAGDQLLCRVVDTMRAHLRPYDLIVRYGGDEFLCALLDVNLADAAQRFLVINESLAASPRASISTGIAELTAVDSLDNLVARADAALRQQRQQRLVDQPAAGRPAVKEWRRGDLNP